MILVCWGARDSSPRAFELTVVSAVIGHPFEKHSFQAILKV